MRIGEKKDFDVIQYLTFPPFLTKKVCDVASTNKVHGLTLFHELFSLARAPSSVTTLSSLLTTHHVSARRLSTTDPFQGVAVIAAMYLMSLLAIYLIKGAIHIRHISGNNR